MKKRVALAVLAATLVSQVTFSQTVTQGVEWFSWTNNIKVNKRLTFVTEGQFRFAGMFEPMQFQFRGAADVQLTKRWSVVPLGYVYTWNPLYGKQPNRFVNNEHRLWQQVMFKHEVGKLRVSHRARLEQRYMQVHRIDNGEVINEGFNFYSNRLRYRFMACAPLTPKVSAAFYDEIFYSWGSRNSYRKPDQNRLFIGTKIDLNKRLSIMPGLLYQMLVKANGAMKENNFGLQIAVTQNIDLTD